jgi:N-methylhydantoinase B
MRGRIDPAELSIAAALFSSVAEEMGVTLGRSAHSPNIKERRDYSCAVFDARARLVAQAAHIPVHLGAMHAAVEAAMPLAPFAAGDIVILNDPYLGGTHLPDITMVSPVFAYGEGDHGSAARPTRASGRAEQTQNPKLVGFVASRAHHADVGGISPGSMPLAEELIQEGVVIPPIKLYELGRLNQAVLDLLLRNMRAPGERRGDLDAQIAAQRRGEERLREIVSRYGMRQARRLTGALMDYAERMTRAALSMVPEGEYEFEDYLDDDGVSDDPVPIRVRVTIRGGAMHCDFTGSAPERPSSINAVAAVTRSAVYYVVRCLLEALVPGGDAVPANHGCFRPVSFALPERSVVNASPPRAVAAGNVETSQRIVDTVLGALATALPDLIPATSAGTMNNVTIGGITPTTPHSAYPEGLVGRAEYDIPTPYNVVFAYYETIGGGAGASPERDGLDAVHTHMTNTMNTPAEALEMTYPFRLIEYAIRRGSGGAGRYRGGDGIVRTYELLAPATVTILSERRRRAPWPLAGGEPGSPGRNLLERVGDVGATGPSPLELPSKTQLKLAAGDRLTIETPGGAGWGS